MVNKREEIELALQFFFFFFSQLRRLWGFGNCDLYQTIGQPGTDAVSPVLLALQLVIRLCTRIILCCFFLSSRDVCLLSVFPEAWVDIHIDTADSQSLVVFV